MGEKTGNWPGVRITRKRSPKTQPDNWRPQTKRTRDCK